MPDDLLRFVTGPQGSSLAWLWLPALLTAAILCWYVAVFALTSSRGRRSIVQRARDTLARRRFLGSVRRIRARLAAGEIDAVAAGADLNRTLRGFLQRATGTPVEYLQVPDMTDGEIASVAALFSRLDDIRFNALSAEDAEQLGAAAEEVIASWT